MTKHLSRFIIEFPRLISFFFVLLINSNYNNLGIHFHSQEELKGIVDHINTRLKDDPDLKNVLPVNPENDDIFDAIGDGIVLW